MKQKELIQLSVAVLILCLAGVLIFNMFFTKKSTKKGYEYEDVKPISSSYDSQLLSKITAASVKDFYLPPDLKSGIGNPSPFKPIN